MTVKELINKLQKLEQHRKVLCLEENGTLLEINKIKLNKHWHVYMLMNDPTNNTGE